MAQIEHCSPVSGTQLAAKRAYHAPVLEHHGDARDLTLGPSPGNGESGNPRVYFRHPRPGEVVVPGGSGRLP